MTNKFALTAVTLMTAAFAAAVSAAPGCPGLPPAAPASDDASAYYAEIGQELNLTAQQKGVWERYTQARDKAVAEHRAWHEANRPPARGDRQAHIEHRAQHEQLKGRLLADVGKARAELVKTLTPEQRDVLDASEPRGPEGMIEAGPRRAPAAAPGYGPGYGPRHGWRHGGRHHGGYGPGYGPGGCGYAPGCGWYEGGRPCGAWGHDGHWRGHWDGCPWR